MLECYKCKEIMPDKGRNSPNRPVVGNLGDGKHGDTGQSWGSGL